MRANRVVVVPEPGVLVVLSVSSEQCEAFEWGVKERERRVEGDGERESRLCLGRVTSDKSFRLPECQPPCL